MRRSRAALIERFELIATAVTELCLVEHYFEAI